MANATTAVRYSRGWLSDVTPAGWIAGKLHPRLQDVGSVVPEGFDAYARVLHPAGESGAERWWEIARRSGRIVHPEMQLHMISRPAGTSPSGDSRDLGAGFRTGLPKDLCRTLIEVLRPATSTPSRCWFCVWEGYGGLDDRGVDVRVELPERRYLLASGAIDDAVPDALIAEPPEIWWPDDRAWVVVSEIDYAWTYVGGTEAVIDAVLAHPDLEALPAKLTDKPFYGSDLLNAALDAPAVP